MENPTAPQINKMNGVQLEFLLSKHHIPYKPNSKIQEKKQAAKDNLCPTEDMKDKLGQLRGDLGAGIRGGGDEQHDYYRETFNVQDLSDKLWYQVEPKGQVHMHWTHRFFFALMRQNLINAWVAYNYDKETELGLFAYRSMIAERTFQGVHLKPIRKRTAQKKQKDRRSQVEKRKKKEKEMKDNGIVEEQNADLNDEERFVSTDDKAQTKNKMRKMRKRIKDS